jgi:hypothetical protein
LLDNPCPDTDVTFTPVHPSPAGTSLHITIRVISL